jgi:hypothetical protein
MKKQSFMKLAKFLLVIACAIPFLGQAQTEKISFGRPAYMRPYDKEGINLFETTKEDSKLKYEGKKISLGAGFTQQF